MKYCIFLGLISVVLSGCYPVYKTIRLPFDAHIVDENGKRVEGADVLLITEQHPAKVPLKFVLIQTDAEGIAIFKSVKEWKMENLIIHGIQNYSWSMCVSKAGYGTVDNIALSDFPSQKINVVLKKTEYVSEDCSSWVKE